jgi:hypothetical protein
MDRREIRREGVSVFEGLAENPALLDGGECGPIRLLRFTRYRSHMYQWPSCVIAVVEKVLLIVAINTVLVAFPPEQTRANNNTSAQPNKAS